MTSSSLANVTTRRPAAQGRVEAQQQQMRRPQGGPPQPPHLLPQHGPAQREVGRGAVGEVAQGQPVGPPAGLVQHQQVGDAGGSAGPDQGPQLGPAPVHAPGARQQQAELLGEDAEAGAGLAGGGDHHLGGLQPRPPVLVVMATGRSPHPRRVELQLLLQGQGLAPQLRGQQPVLIQRLPESLLLVLLPPQPFLLRSALQVLAAFPGLATELGTSFSAPRLSTHAGTSQHRRRRLAGGEGPMGAPGAAGKGREVGKAAPSLKMAAGGGQRSALIQDGGRVGFSPPLCPPSVRPRLPPRRAR
ncbi:uncharacterized protein LOC141938786 [Strix uralensis]|uniref:uncharacterized protein LOC141938786 n=1 Tax=Strix uralensis TaxID=36305 RepID=UPI003DA59664